MYSTYTCKANNGVGKTAMTYYRVLVKFAPVVKFASQMGRGSRNHLWCRIAGIGHLCT